MRWCRLVGLGSLVALAACGGEPDAASTVSDADRAAAIEEAIPAGGAAAAGSELVEWYAGDCMPAVAQFSDRLDDLVTVTRDLRPDSKPATIQRASELMERLIVAGSRLEERQGDMSAPCTERYQRIEKKFLELAVETDQESQANRTKLEEAKRAADAAWAAVADNEEATEAMKADALAAKKAADARVERMICQDKCVENSDGPDDAFECSRKCP